MANRNGRARTREERAGKLVDLPAALSGLPPEKHAEAIENLRAFIEVVSGWAAIARERTNTDHPRGTVREEGSL